MNLLKSELWCCNPSQKPKIGPIRCVARAGEPWCGLRGRAHGPRIGSACVDIRPSPKTDVLVIIIIFLIIVIFIIISIIIIIIIIIITASVASMKLIYVQHC